LQLEYGVMKTATRLQFSALMKGFARAAAWAVVTVTVGVILVILFGSPLSASSSSPDDLPGSSQKKETGPWVYPPVMVSV
jgi:hypothetical protein